MQLYHWCSNSNLKQLTSHLVRVIRNMACDPMPCARLWDWDGVLVQASQTERRLYALTF